METEFMAGAVGEREKKEEEEGNLEKEGRKRTVVKEDDEPFSLSHTLLSLALSRKGGEKSRANERPSSARSCSLCGGGHGPVPPQRAPPAQGAP